MSRPVLVYDAACEFCRRWVARWSARTGDRVEYLPLQQRGVLRRFGILLSDALAASQFVGVRGERLSGAEAVFRALEYAPELRVLARVGRLPLLRRVAQGVYQLIAKHRSLAAHVDKLLFGTNPLPPDSRVVRDVFLRALGGVYLIAFASLGAQVKGLYGERGIRPLAPYLDRLRTRLPVRDRLRLMPTVFWLDASDRSLVAVCRAGELGGLLLLLGIAPRMTASALWLLYLSFVSAGREFLSFQWDALLLESGLHAIVIAPANRNERPSWAAVAMMRWLALRLHFESGHAKLASRDPTWRTGEACCVHFETQPLPTRIGWHAHQLPRPIKRAATYATLAIELGAPWLALAPRRLRRAGFVMLAGLQCAIAATGNYAFFNLLTIVDHVWLLDDAVLTKRNYRRGTRPSWSRRAATALTALPIVAASASLLVERLFPRIRQPRAITRVTESLLPLHAVNAYGLFAVMTTSRPEIVFEGSNDGVHWQEYVFRYKPGDPKRGPRWVAPHQPRLDWQLWFAALQRPPTWVLQLMQRLLEGSPDVLSLFERDPFDGDRPRFVRALLYDYKMTDRSSRNRTGAWWHRNLYGIYVPPLELAPAATGAR